MKIIVSILVTIAFAWTGFAQVVENKNSEKLENEKRLFICPMHQEMMLDTSGKCSKCGMELTETVDIKKAYCPNCKDEFYIKNGKCLKCSKKIIKDSRKGNQKK